MANATAAQPACELVEPEPVIAGTVRGGDGRRGVAAELAQRLDAQVAVDPPGADRAGRVRRRSGRCAWVARHGARGWLNRAVLDRSSLLATFHALEEAEDRGCSTN
jgi:hypothetical protein